jgi:hypothetical protein
MATRPLEIDLKTLRVSREDDRRFVFESRLCKLDELLFPGSLRLAGPMMGSEVVLGGGSPAFADRIAWFGNLA